MDTKSWARFSVSLSHYSYKVSGFHGVVHNFFFIFQSAIPTPGV